MVKADPTILVPIFTLGIIVFLSIFAFLIHDKDHRKRYFLYGMLGALGLLTLLIFGSDAKDANSFLASLVKFGFILEGAMLYGAFLALILFASLKSLFGIENKGTYFMFGFGFAFTLFELGLALKCVETIPFVENIVKSTC